MALRLAYREFGDGPPLVVLHGLFGSGTNWGRIARHLSQRYHVLTVDQRNHGASPHASKMSYPRMAEDVLALLEHRGLDRAVWLGHSMGGKTAMCAALLHPGLVARLVVVDIAPVAYRRDYSHLLAAMRTLDLAQVQRRADADRLLAGAIPEDGLRSFLLQNLEGTPEGFRWRINLDGIETSMSELFTFACGGEHASYCGPSAFIRGARSDYIREEDLDAIRARFPRARVHTVENAGHWVHAEAPGEFLSALERSLEDP